MDAKTDAEPGQFVAVVSERITPARALVDAGCTDAEIAEALGIEVSKVAQLPEVAGAGPNDAMDARAERAAFSRVVGGKTWTEKLDRFGGTHRLESEVLPDARAAFEWLARRKPEQWGEGRGKPKHVVVVRFPDRDGQAQGVTIEHGA